MSNIIDVVDIVERIRDVLEDKYGKKVLDKNIAHELGIAPYNIAARKTRNSIPFHPVINFCNKYKISTDWLFFGIGSKERDHAKEDM